MDPMIAEARRGAGSLQPHYQHRLVAYLVREIQPKLDRLIEAEAEIVALRAQLAAATQVHAEPAPVMARRGRPRGGVA